MTESEYEVKCHRVHVFCKYFENIFSICISVIVGMACSKIVAWAISDTHGAFGVFVAFGKVALIFAVAFVGLVFCYKATTTLVHQYRIYMYRKYSNEIEH